MSPEEQGTGSSGQAPRRWVITVSAVITVAGVVATVIRWRTEGPPRDCLTGGGTMVEALICGGPDLFAQLILLWLLVGVPALVLIWLATRGRRRRST